MSRGVLAFGGSKILHRVKLRPASGEFELPASISFVRRSPSAKEPGKARLDKRVSHALPLAMAYGSALAVLADPTRRKVFERLRAGPRPVNVLAAGLPVSRPAVSQHLKVLKGAGLVEERSEGVRRIYSLRREGLMELREWLDSFWGDALEAFRLEAEKSYKNRRNK
jgi:DNA-binding transcriptional ArsR family regulator